MDSTTSSPQLDPFDITKLRLSQDFVKQVGVKKALLTVPVRKPTRQEFAQVHPSQEMRLETAVLELKEDREIYLVAPDLWAELPGETVPVALFTTVNRQGVLTLWPVKLPREDGRTNPWHVSAMEAAHLAMKGWVRIVANMALGAYDVFQATGDLPPPEWPDLPMQEIVRIAFKDRYIQAMDHPVVRKLQGDM